MNTPVKYLMEKQRDLIFSIVVPIVAFLVYANSIGSGFVTDDPSVILHNPALRGTPLSLFQTIDTISDTQLLPFYRPLTYLTFYAEGRLHGFNSYLMHLLNVLLHAANAFLVYRLARTLFHEHATALIAGLLFAAHPLHSESVNFLSGGRNTMLACLFALMAYLAHRKGVVQNKRSFALLGGLLFLAGLFSKESAMMMLPFILWQEWTERHENRLWSWSRSAMRLAPYAGAVIGYLALRWSTLSRLGIQTSIIPGFGGQKLQELYIIPGLAERLFDNIYIIPKYLSTVMWPVSLSPRYSIPGDFHLIALPLIAGWVFIIISLVWLLKRGRSRTILFGLCWTVTFWLPVSGIFTVSIIQMADRYFYMPAIGLWLITADLASRLSWKEERSMKYGSLAAVFIFVILSLLTVDRNFAWKNEITLFSQQVEQYPENPYGYYHLGTAYMKRKGPNDLELAEKNFEMVLDLDPSTQSVQTPLGHIRLERGDFEGALNYYSEALGLYPFAREARINRGVAYERLGRPGEALDDYRFYLTIPTYNHVPGSQEYAEARLRELSSSLAGKGPQVAHVQ